jgi:hypothetical protein
MSPRTAKYVEAMVREDFDYDEWLREIREEEAQAKQVPIAITRRDVVAVQGGQSDQDIRSSAAGSGELGTVIDT